jgi:hypothetical protein
LAFLKDWRQKVTKLNEAVEASKAKCKPFSVKDKFDEEDDDDVWASLS